MRYDNKLTNVQQNKTKESIKTPKYSNITVKLVGEDGNAFVILGKVRKALKDAEVSGKEITEFVEEATSGDHDTLLQTVMEWVNVV